MKSGTSVSEEMNKLMWKGVLNGAGNKEKVTFLEQWDKITDLVKQLS